MPGNESEMTPPPLFDAPWYKGSGKLQGKVAIVAGGDSGIGRSVSVLFAREGANVVIVYHEQHEDANFTKVAVEKEGGKCITIATDLAKKEACEEVVRRTLEAFGKLDILINHHGTQWKVDNILDVTPEQIQTTFSVNVFSFYYLTQAAIPHLKPGSSIINTTSGLAYTGRPGLTVYSSTKAAITNMTYSLSAELVAKGIRVNGVAPGPIWTPFIPGSFEPSLMKSFGHEVPMKRAGQPEEVAPSYVFLASNDSSYMTGQVLHPNGGLNVSS